MVETEVETDVDWNYILLKLRSNVNEMGPFRCLRDGFFLCWLYGSLMYSKCQIIAFLYINRSFGWNSRWLQLMQSIWSKCRRNRVIFIRLYMAVSLMMFVRFFDVFGNAESMQVSLCKYNFGWNWRWLELVLSRSNVGEIEVSLNVYIAVPFSDVWRIR